MSTDPQHLKSQRQKRSVVYYTIFSIVFVALAIYLLVSLQTLILPIVLGFLSAYLCIPLLDMLRRNGIPKAVGIIILFLAFFMIIMFVSREVVRLIPDEKEMLELKVNLQYQINDRYREYMGISDLDGNEEGNIFYEVFGDELNPMIITVNQFLMLDDEETELFEEYRNTEDDDGEPLISNHIWHHFEQNLEDADQMGVEEELVRFDDEGDEEVKQEDTGEESLIAAIINIASIWLIMPVVFLFILVDDGRLKKGLMRVIPNTYFEMALTAIDNVDQAIGNYLRGTFLEVLAVTLSFWILLFLIGLDWGVSLLLALIAGLANILPFFGSIVGLVIIALFALMEGHMGEINPIIPFIHADHLMLWSVLVVLIVQLIDNIYFKPVIYGSVVDLHPLVVFLAAIAGSVMFGFIGLLFAIPAIVIIKELYGTIHRELKAYFLIY